MTGNYSHALDLLSPRLKSFLATRLKWKNLNPIQEQAMPIISSKKDTLVISPTASGKTEAVLIPIFNEIISNNLKPLSVIYVSPLKALINDMNERIEKWCDYFNLTVTKWHGDVPRTKKQAFLQNPTDFLLITPESLEVIFMNKSLEEKQRIFENLQFIIIDEIHYFVESDRGTQLNSLLNRIEQYVETKTTIVGLSATVGNPKTVSAWLRPNSPANIVEYSSSRLLQYKVLCGNDLEICKVLSRYVNKKLLIFVHSRKNAERYYNLLKTNLNVKNIYLHHSSIDKDIREESEEKFKHLENGFMVCTSTLELGIDIGNIDIVIQIRPPHNVSSNLQRIGRSGRRSKHQRTIIFYQSDTDIFITLSEICLIKENHIENIDIPEKPKDIYFHQILSSIFENGKIKQGTLFKNLKDSYVFSRITPEEFKVIIKNMEELEFIHNNDGFLSLGYEFEKKFGKRNFMDFYSVFCPNYEYVVMEGGKNIGTLDASFVIMMLKEGLSFILSGEQWKVTKIDYKKFKVRVQKDLSKKGDIPQWLSEGGVIDSLISRKIYDILLGDFNEEYIKTFDEFSKNKIHEYVEHASDVGFRKGIIPIEIEKKSNKVYIYTFAGLKANTLLSTIFNLKYDIHNIADTPYYSSFKFRDKFSYDTVLDVLYNVETILNEPEINSLIHEKTKKFVKNKFINYLPYEDNVKLKMEILYNAKDLIKVINENSPSLVYIPTKFKKWK